MARSAYGPRWTEDELGFLEHNRGKMTYRAIGKTLGRSRSSVVAMASRINRGWSPTGGWFPITEDQRAFIRQTPHFTAEQVAEHLGISYGLVTAERARLGRDEGLFFGTGGSLTKDPFAHGRRRVLAKTCLGCGLLLNGEFFAEPSRRSYTSRCARCRHAEEETKKQSSRRLKRTYELQAMSLPYAKNNGAEWTEADHRVLADPDLQQIEKSIHLGRTFFAVGHAMQRFGYTVDRSLGDPQDGQWRIAYQEAS
jgi:hypothetical protein